MQNSALGALLASLHFPAHPLAAVPCAISGADRAAGQLRARCLPFTEVPRARFGCPPLPSCLCAPLTPATPAPAAACTHSIMGSLLAGYWRTQPTEDDVAQAQDLSGSLGGAVGFSGAGRSGSAQFQQRSISDS